uniref:Uncharacterized protein n=1 Tax=Arundo donax TaxID=35708 RepID=A0A0A8YNH8_ARUDO
MHVPSSEHSYCVKPIF